MSTALLDRDGCTFGVRFRELAGTRAVVVGTRTRDLRTLWNDLDECAMTVDELVTPAFRARRGGRARDAHDRSADDLVAMCARAPSTGDTDRIGEAVRLLASALPRTPPGAARELCLIELLEMQRLLATATDLRGLLVRAEASRRREDAGANAANAERLIAAHPGSTPLRDLTRIRELGRWAR